MAEAIDLVRSKRDADGRWWLENPHESELVDACIRDLGFDMDEGEGRPSPLEHPPGPARVALGRFRRYLTGGLCAALREFTNQPQPCWD
ncbi:MAG: hypothetical protein WD830_05715 [Chloroflexota bacterium]